MSELAKAWYDRWGAVSRGSFTSGNYGHKGVPGQHGGSAAGGGHGSLGISAGASGDEVKQAVEEHRQVPEQGKDWNNNEPMPLEEVQVLNDWIDGKVELDSKHWGEGGEDKTMKALLEQRGYTGRPIVVSKAEMDKVVGGGGVELWRGASERNIERVKTGDMWVGRGQHGSGIYTATDKSTAQEYVRDSGGLLMRAALRPDARIVEQTDWEFWAESSKQLSAYLDARGVKRPMYWQRNLTWPAAVAGVDAVRTARGDVIVLNRTVLVIEE